VSLIGDALRKARQEAAERDSDRKGILFSAKIADSPSRSNLGLGLALGALIAVIATVAGGVAVWWILGVGDRAQDQGQPPAEKTAAILEPESASEGSDSGGNSSSDSDQRQQSAAVRAAEATSEFYQAPILNPPASEPATTTEAATASASGSASASDSNPATGFMGKENGDEIYIMEADLGNGVNLSLGYLIFREEDPFAEINGVELHLGGTIEGFRVKDITRDRVTLSNGRRTIVLRAP